MDTSPEYLDYMDQASFLGLRALGRGPVIQFVWRYRRPVDRPALGRFCSRLGAGLLGRLVAPSPLPFGRHRWVGAPEPPLEWIDDDLAPEQLTPWLDALESVPVDPQYGPGWRLLGRPLADGGAAVVLLVSHTIADGLGTSAAVAVAAQGTQPTVSYPRPGGRSSSQTLGEDLHATLRSLPDGGRAVAAAMRFARTGATVGTGSPAHRREPGRDDSPAIIVPGVLLSADAGHWSTRAGQLGGSDTALVAAFAALVGSRLGRVAQDGTVQVALPVSLRVPGDTRGNALSGITLVVDPVTCAADLRPLRSSIAAALAELSEHGHPAIATLPLTPFIPRRLARHLEGLALGPGQPVGCSHLGVLDPATGRPDGTDADQVWVRSLESLTRTDLLRLRGTLRVVSAVTHGRIGITVSGWQPGSVESGDDLVGHVSAAADQLGLRYRLD